MRASTHESEIYSGVIGLSDVEVLEIRDNQVVARSLPRPDTCNGCFDWGGSIAILPFDFDGDDTEDLWVSDSFLYLIRGARGAYPTVFVPGDELPIGNPNMYVELSVRSDGVLEVGNGWPLGASFARKSGKSGKWTYLGYFDLPSVPRVTPKRMLTPLPVEGSWLVMGQGFFYRLKWQEAGLALSVVEQPEPSPPILLPYAVFDDLVVVAENATCGTSLVGIGRFVGEPFRQFGTMVRIGIRDGSGVMTREEIDLDFDALALAPIRETDGTMILGVLGYRAGHSALAIYRVRGCDLPELLVETEAEISFRRPPMPYFGETFPVDAPYVKLVGQVSGGMPTFVAYDGYDAYTHQLSKNEEHRWTVASRIHHVHETRHDIAFQ